MKDHLQGIACHTPLTGPETVHIDIANTCNLRCLGCWHHSPLLRAAQRPSREWSARMMTLAAFRKILESLHALGGLRQIIISGMGEPFLNPKIYEMVALCQAYKVQVSILTNLLEADLPRLLEDPNGLDLHVSIGGVSRSTWNEYHQGSDSLYERLLTQLERLRAAGFRARHVHVINRCNFREIPQMVEWARTWPAREVIFKPASLDGGTERLALGSGDRHRLTTSIVPEARALAARLHVDADFSLFDEEQYPIHRVGCFMGYVYCRITVDSELLYCCNTEISVGRLGPEMPFAALWTGERYKELRERIGAGHFFPGCIRCGKFRQNRKWAERVSAFTKKEGDRTETVPATAGSPGKA